MTELLTPIVLLFVPCLAILCTKGRRHSLPVAFAYMATSLVLLWALISFEFGIEAPDGTIGLRVLLPYFALSIPLTLGAVGVAGVVRHVRTKGGHQ